MFRSTLSIAVLSCLLVAVPSMAVAAQSKTSSHPAAKPAVHRGRQYQHRLGVRARGAARHRRENRRAHRRVPPEERPVQEGRGADERARHRREELPQAEAADHRRAGEGRPRSAGAEVAGSARPRRASGPSRVMTRSAIRRLFAARTAVGPGARVTLSAAAVPQFLAAAGRCARQRRGAVPVGAAAARADGGGACARRRSACSSRRRRRLQLRRLCRRQRQRRADARHPARSRSAASARPSGCRTSSRASISARSRVCRRSIRAARRRAPIRSGSAPATSPASPPRAPRRPAPSTSAAARDAQYAVRDLRRDGQDAHVEVRTADEAMETAMSGDPTDRRRRAPPRARRRTPHRRRRASARAIARALIDVSAGGALIETSHRLLPGASVELQVERAPTARACAAGAALRRRRVCGRRGSVIAARSRSIAICRGS